MRESERTASAQLLPQLQQDHDQHRRANPQNRPNGHSPSRIVWLEEAAYGTHRENRDSEHHHHRDKAEAEAGHIADPITEDFEERKVNAEGAGRQATCSRRGSPRFVAWQTARTSSSSSAGSACGPFDIFRREAAPTSAALAAAWHPYVDACVTASGPDRCMFESNFPSTRSRAATRFSGTPSSGWR